jgi:hypothetical protein
MFERFIIDWKLHVREIYYRLETSCSRDLLWIRFFMFERFIIDWKLHVREIYCGLDSIFIYQISRHTCLPSLLIHLRLSLLYATSSLASPVHSYGGHASALYFIIYWSTHLLSSPITVSLFFRGTEIAHITTFDSFSLTLLKHFLLYYIMTSSSL